MKSTQAAIAMVAVALFFVGAVLIWNQYQQHQLALCEALWSSRSEHGIAIKATQNSGAAGRSSDFFKVAERSFGTTFEECRQLKYTD